MKKYVLFICTVSFLIFNTQAQQQAQFTQYYINPYIINQAAGGTSPNLEASVGFRKQWAGFQDSPLTYYASFYMPYNIKNQRQTSHHKGHYNHWNTIGGYFYDDVTGPTRRTAAYFSFAHNMSTSRKTRLSFAISGGTQQFSYNTANLEIADKDDIKLSNNGTEMVPDLNLNVWFYHDNFYLGASSHQLLENKFDFEGKESNDYASSLVQHHYFQGAYKFAVDYNWDIYTTSMVKYVPNTPTSTDIGAVARYNKQYWVGVNYRIQDALGIIAGMNILKHLDISYTYEVSLSPIMEHNFGSHEIVLIYRHKHDGKLMCAKDFW